MPQLKAAKKSLKVNARKRVVNDRWRRKLRESLHAVRDAIANKDKKVALEAVIKADSILDKTARRNIIHPNKASRKKSRLHKAVANIKE